ncbi:phosphatidylinositol-specific phospholipase C [Loa loa]|uniref:Phosphatidylinositol-specific phospholipase C n=1 Tax=Loa loa TaxID=7209 RepID=A0A1I7W1H8_LOALO|nr:phosphatidylinositol-specific phospholipase C [Loa loa]EFO14182.2 phosphatidylinositol-specific phospholipase C [Loa loa]
MADWMSELPVAARDKPIMTLAIPGSHLSGTCSLKEDSEITPDQTWCVRVLDSNDMIRKAVYNWSKVQTMSIKQQLEAGIRFLDVQVAYINEGIYVVHGLRSMEIRDLFKRVDDFLSVHPKEIVLIDINHFYEFREQHHDKLLDMINNLFGDRLITRPATIRTAMNYTLNKIWSSTGRVIIFYQPPLPSLKANDINGHAGPSDIVKLPNYVWSRQFIKSPWPKTDDAKRMVDDVGNILQTRVLEDGFQVCQAIVTLTVNSIIRQPTGTFEARFGRRATRALIDWLRQNGHSYRSNINVIVADFVDEDGFCSTMIDLNK